MECFFGARELPDHEPNSKSTVVMFHIPDVGIRFKAPFAGMDQDHGDLASLLALLEFIDSNQKYFKNSNIQLYGDNLNVINQINGRSKSRQEFAHLLEKAAKYRDKYRFSLEWVPSTENSADDSLLN
ncbi:MAG: hypothetical protein DRP45_08255 [Candidatus Zixiibacteriota bacterium]|nr:MAG: hypothetical protein DRP45_08255 [candidate division Zixibacteria bacterium]